MSEDKNLQEKVAALEAALEKKSAEADKLKKALEKPGRDNEVKGVYKKGKKSYAFAAGHFLLRKTTTGTTVPTEEVIKLASDPDYRPSDKAIADYQGLVGFDHTAAVELLDSLIEKKYGYLIEA